MTKPVLLLLGLGILLATSPAVAGGVTEERCGWLDNPTPGNFSLRDRDGEWTIAEQGGYQAPGFDDMPDMTTQGWVKTNIHYGYGCACLSAQVDKKSRLITKLVSARPIPLKRCKADKKLPR